LVNHTEVFFWGITGAVTGGATGYPLPGSGAWSAASTLRIPIPRGGTLKNLYVYARTAPGGAVTDTIRVRVDGAAGPITCSLVGAAVSASDTTNTQAINAGQNIEIQYVAGAGSAAANIAITLEIEFLW